MGGTTSKKEEAIPKGFVLNIMNELEAINSRSSCLFNGLQSSIVPCILSKE